VPFFGGVAVGASGYKSEVERGLVALMGPGFSLLTTALFAFLAGESGDSLMRNLASRLAEMFPKAAHLNIIRSWAGVIENSPDGRPIIERLTHPDNVTIASMSGVGFGLSPASGHAIRDLVIDGKCSFADIDILKLSRFAGLEPDWRERRGWVPLS